MEIALKKFALGRCAFLVATTFGCTLAGAVEFKTEDGWRGNLSTTVSIASSWRAEAPDSRLYSAGDGVRIGLPAGTGGTNTDSGTVNWDKGDRFSTPIKALVDFSLRKNDMGMFLRAKAWYDQALRDEGVRGGNGDSGWHAGGKLSDASQPSLNKYDGLAFLDAYVYDTYQLGETAAQFRVGKQVVNWGESLFVQGVNQLSPIDATALRRPGTEVKEALLPVWSLYSNLGLGGGVSVEGFYQLKWEPHVIDSCGGYWAPVESSFSTSPGSSGCKSVVTTASAALGNPGSYTNGVWLPLTNGRDGRDSGQFGVALRAPLDFIDSELGLYAMRINSRTPIISGRLGSGFGVANATMVGGLPSASGFWEYPNGINIFGASLSTNIIGWSVGVEVSHTPNQPVQINGNDIVGALITGGGVLGSTAQSAFAANGAGAEISGYDRIAKTQIQANTIKILPGMLGASQGVFVAEVAAQSLDMPNNGRRYGRSFIFGSGSFGSVNTCGTSNLQLDGCKNDGYITDFAWGYRLRASLDYPNAFESGFTLTPSIFFGHDVSGYSSDSQFVQDRQILTFGVRADYLKKFVIDMGYTTFSNRAKYDMFRDRDFYSVALSYTF